MLQLVASLASNVIGKYARTNYYYLASNSTSGLFNQQFYIVNGRINFFRRRFFYKGAFALLPIKIFYLVAENAAIYRMVAQDYLKRITLYMTCDGAEQSEADFLVVFFLRNANRRAAAFLFMPCLRVKVKPNQVAFFWNVTLLYHSSFPTECPVETSE